MLALAPIALALISAGEPDARDEVVRMLAAKPSRTDLVVVLDVSGSMAKHFDVAKRFVGDLADLASPDDSISFIVFADRAFELLPPVTVRAGGADALRARIKKLRSPHAPHTDLGAGLEATLDALLRPNYAPLSMVFLITDFCSEPPAKSPYLGSKEHQGPCRRLRFDDALKKKSARLFGAGDQSVRSFAVTLEPTSEAGLDAARQTLGSLVRIDVESGDLAKALASVRARFAYDRAALAIEQMLKHPPISVEPPREPLPFEGRREIELGFTSSGPLPMLVHVENVAAKGGDVSFELVHPERAIELPPRTGASAPSPVPVLLRAERESGRRANPFASERSIEIDVSLDVELSPSAPIEKLIGATPRSKASVHERLEVRFEKPDPSRVPVALAPKSGFEQRQLAPGESATVPLSLKSLVSWGDLEATCTIGGRAFDPVLVVPSSTVTLEATVLNQATARSWWIETTRSVDADLAGTCEVTAVAPDGMKLPLGRHPVAAKVALSWTEGVPRALVFGVLLALILGSLLYFGAIKPRSLPAALTGRLVVYAGPGPFRQVTIPLAGRARIALQGSPAKDAEIRLDEDRVVLPALEGTAAELYAEKVGHRSVMRLRKLTGDEIVVDAQPLENAPVVVRKGRARISLGEYRCRIE
jgi:VWA domain-containing protein